MINEASITNYLKDNFEDVQTSDDFGYTFFFYSDDHMVPFVTIASSDNEYDRVSNLNRPGVFRVNIGVSRETFQKLFGTNKIGINNYDFTALDTIMPHPEYSAQFFICVLNPSETTFEKVKSFFAEAYDIAVKRYNRRKAH
jgi:hypothetical protein